MRKFFAKFSPSTESFKKKVAQSKESWGLRIDKSIEGKTKWTKLSRKMIDLFLGKDYLPQKEHQSRIVEKLGKMGRTLDEIWSQKETKLSQDDAAWRQHGHEGNHYEADFRHNERDGSVDFLSYQGVYGSEEFGGDLNEVDGYLSPDEKEHTSASYFRFLLRKPFVGRFRKQRLVEVELNGRQFVPNDLFLQGVRRMRIEPNGFEVEIDQYKSQLNFEDSTSTAVFYTSYATRRGNEGEDILGSDGPIQEVKLLVTTSEGEYPGDKDKARVTRHLDIKRVNDQWEIKSFTDKSDRKVTATAQTLPNGDVRISITVGEENKKMIVPKVDVNIALNKAEKLVASIHETAKPRPEREHY